MQITNIINALLGVAAFAATTLALPAQTCNFNTYPIHLVNAVGQPMPTTVIQGEPFSEYSSADVYLALGPNFPSGIYVVQVTNNAISEILSGDLLVDRTIQVTNDNGVIRMMRLGATPGLKPFGAGLDGQGDSMPLCPLFSPSSLSEACLFKVWITDYYVNPDNDPRGYVLGVRGGINPVTNQCAVTSFAKFRMNEGNPATISGIVFDDTNRDGVRDPGEAGIPGIAIRLVGDLGFERNTTTGADGRYVFPDVPGGVYTVLVAEGSFEATTPSSHPISICGCAPAEAPDFGRAGRVLDCNGRTPGFWSNPNGRRIILAGGFLTDLGALQVVNAAGQRFTTANIDTFRTWLLSAKATNMAYMLSAQTVAMHFNLRAGFVDRMCFVDDPQVGLVNIQELVNQAVLSLSLHPYTPTGHPQRSYQERLKNALDRANNNSNWH